MIYLLVFFYSLHGKQFSNAEQAAHFAAVCLRLLASDDLSMADTAIMQLRMFRFYLATCSNPDSLRNGWKQNTTDPPSLA